MIKTILKTCLIVIISLFITSTMCISVTMKCVGGWIDINSYRDPRDKNTKLQHLFPCLDKQDNPKKVMVLQKNGNGSNSEQTVCIYTIKDLMKGCLHESQPDFIHPQSKSPAANNPAFYSGYKDTPFCFQQGLYFLVQDTKKQWAIYHPNRKNKPDYHGAIKPWFFQKYKNSLIYSRGKEIVCLNNVLDKIQFEILSFDMPDSNNKLICYYNEHHNPDIVLIRKSKENHTIQTAASELYPKFSTNKDYFAYFRKRNPDDIWDIIVCQTQSPNAITIIENVRKYDMPVKTAFLYSDSFQWMDNRLYYMKHEFPSTIFEFNPANSKKKRIIKLTGNSFEADVEFGVYKKKKRHVELTVELISTNWFQVAKKNGQLMFVVECLIQTRSSNSNSANKFEHQVRRMLIFQ